MKLYCISGLGADQRVFAYLKLNYELIPLEWISPLKNESITAYATRLATKINTNEQYGIMGVSFGGLVATEISKQLSPSCTILISSVETKNELPPIFRFIAKTKLLNLLPAAFFTPPKFIAHRYFGTKKKELLNQILNDTNNYFAKWAVNELVNWKNEDKIDNNKLKIEGEKDRLLPPTKDKKKVLVANGGHLMIVDKAEEISLIINKWLETHSLEVTK